MFQAIKRLFYFPLASYFRFFASIRLKKWKPRIIVITGSSGKTTLLHLIESQLGDTAKYSHGANSSFGIPFDILDIHRKDLTFFEWPAIFILPLINVFKPVPRENLYVVEADCDRPHEGDFLSRLLKPEITLWTNVSRTHSMNFDGLVKKGKFKSIEEAVAYEFGFFAERTKNAVVINADSLFELTELKRVKAKVIRLSLRDNLKSYRVNLFRTEFVFTGGKYSFSYLLPRESGMSVLMCRELISYLGCKFKSNFPGFGLSPGRSSLFKGVKDITIIDSTYNANLDSMKAIINMFDEIETGNKWIVLGDMLEQGSKEKEEHVKLAEIVTRFNFKRIILLGPRVIKYTFPVLNKKLGSGIVIKCFYKPGEVLDYLKNNLEGGEVILFKGARFLEGVIGNLLKNKADTLKLARREKIWEMRRKKWGL